MGFFSKFLKGLGFEEEEESPKPQKVVEKKKEDKRSLATYNLKDVEEKIKVEENKQPENTFDVKNNSVETKQAEQNSQFDIVNVSSQVEVQTVVKRLKDGEKILINMSALNNEDKTRSLDFLSGAVFALGLSIQKVDGAVYLIQ